MLFTREDVYDMILGSGALTYSWYYAATEVMPPHDEDPWLVNLMMENPDDEGYLEVKLTYPTLYAAAIRLVDDTGLSNWGSTAKLGASQEARRQADLLLKDDEDVDFDADTADQLIQIVAYGHVVFG